MFFGKEPERKFSHAITRCVLFKGTTKVYIIDDKSFFTVVFKRQAKNYATDGIVNDIVNESEQVILDLLKKKPGLNASEIAESISKSWRTTMRYLKSLNEKELIEFRGAPKTGGYYLK